MRIAQTPSRLCLSVRNRNSVAAQPVLNHMKFQPGDPFSSHLGSGPDYVLLLDEGHVPCATYIHIMADPEASKLSELRQKMVEHNWKPHPIFSLCGSQNLNVCLKNMKLTNFPEPLLTREWVQVYASSED
jgi:hypothetical protein